MSFQNVRHLPRIGISSAMRMFGLTARALRFYEEKGLVEAGRDRLNTRFYGPRACAQLEWISRLRRAGASLPDIAKVLRLEEETGTGREHALKTLENRTEALRKEMAVVDGVIAELRAGRGAARGPAPQLVRTVRQEG